MSKVVVITGCSKGGIGWALAEEFHRRGHSVFAAGRSLGKMEGLPSEVTKVELDVNSADSVRAGVAGIVQRAGRIDICINNAGQGCVAPLIEVEAAAVRQTFDVNVFGLLTMTQAVAPHMVEKRSGTIVNIGSIVAWTPTPWAGIYCATKACVESLSNVLRMELKGFGVNVVYVAPGAIKSAIGASNDKRTILKPNSPYASVESYVRSRGSWSQNPQSTSAEALACAVADAALRPSPPRYLAFGYRSTGAWLSYYLPTWMKEWLWGSQFGTGEVGK